MMRRLLCWVRGFHHWYEYEGTYGSHRRCCRDCDKREVWIRNYTTKHEGWEAD